MHGSWEIPVDLLVEFRYLLRDVDFEGVCLPDHIDWIVENTGRSDAGTAKSNFRSSKISFTELVDTFCSPKCENPRDKVYGLQGLVEPATRLNINYLEAAEEVFLQSVGRILQD
jgi:hypothetical protein